MTTNMNDMRSWVGRTATDSSGDKIGKIEDIYLDDQTGQPEWLAVKTGMFGANLSFIPLQGAAMQGDDVLVPFSKAQVKDAPNAAADGALSQEEEARLYAHYGMQYGENRSDSGLPEGGMATQQVVETSMSGTGETVGHDTSGPVTDDAMTRSEERLRVGTQQVEAGRVRLRKWIETEQVTTTVPVSREEVRIEREAITDANVGKAMDGPALSEEEHEVVLTAEQPVVQKEVTPVERIRLDTETVTEQVQVSESVARERIGLDRDADGQVEEIIDNAGGTTETR